jgi:hypothetical protein
VWIKVTSHVEVAAQLCVPSRDQEPDTFGLPHTSSILVELAHIDEVGSAIEDELTRCNLATVDQDDLARRNLAAAAFVGSCKFF